ncbi:unnamed protein product [Polarella glacialis]|uniref:Uncharacterized protein n=1 Tax=Polarella glacialis TaxID=89957 RepID=A0A813H2P6_POLGL|nr:unnamed protein product [Polarella glacialis]
MPISSSLAAEARPIRRDPAAEATPTKVWSPFADMSAKEKVMHTSALESARAEAVFTSTSSAGMQSPAARGRACGDQPCYHCLRPKWKRICLGPGGDRALANDEHMQAKKAKSKAMIADEPPSGSTALATMLVGALGIGVIVGACASSALELWLRNRVQEKKQTALQHS